MRSNGRIIGARGGGAGTGPRAEGWERFLAILVFGYMVAFVLVGLLTRWNRIAIWAGGPVVGVLTGFTYLNWRRKLPMELMIQLALLAWNLTGLALAVYYPAFIRTYRLLVELTVLSFMVIVALSRRDAFRVAMWGILLAAAGLFIGFELTGQVPSMTGEDLTTAERLGGGDANAVGFVATVGLAAAMALWGTQRRLVERAIVLVLVPLLLKGLISSASKSAFLLALAFALGWLLWARAAGSRKKISTQVVSVVLVLSIFSGVNWVMQRTYLGVRFHKFATPEELMVKNSRSKQYQEAWRIFKRSPVWGVGAGQFIFYSSNHLMGHSDLADLLGTTGAVGVALYLAMYWVTFRRVFMLLKMPGPETFVLRVRVVTLLLLICFLGGLGRDNFLDPLAVVLYATVIAESYRLEHLVAREGFWPKRRKLRAPALSRPAARSGGLSTVRWPGAVGRRAEHLHR